MAMQTLTIKINNVKALKLLEDLEELNLIQVINKIAVKEKKGKLSERLAGSTSSKQAKVMRKELSEMRDEWERNI
jgi:hypothetical protein